MNRKIAINNRSYVYEKILHTRSFWPFFGKFRNFQSWGGRWSPHPRDPIFWGSYFDTLGTNNFTIKNRSEKKVEIRYALLFNSVEPLSLNFRIRLYFKLNFWHGFSIRPMKYSTTAYIYYMAWKLTLVLPLRINLHLTFRQLAGYRTCLRKISLPDAGLIPSISILWPYFAIILK